jgi:hypothetical protein
MTKFNPSELIRSFRKFYKFTSVTGGSSYHDMEKAIRKAREYREFVSDYMDLELSKGILNGILAQREKLRKRNA